MGIFAGPEVIEDGLVLALDAANQKSHNLTAVEVLVVAGGGGGGGRSGGGGGAGGLIYNSNFAVTSGSALTVTVGSGGAGGAGSGPPGSDGQNSIFGNLTAIGGGGGGSDGGNAGRSGGSGGGGKYGSGGGSGTSEQGFAGGSGTSTTWKAGGGGGAGGVGVNGVGSPHKCGNGGPGLGFNISGTFTYYAGGGGGGSHNSDGGGCCDDISAKGFGGIGGGGDGGTPGGFNAGSNGTPNTGGGGGGGSTVSGTGGAGGNGGSGIVIVRYPGPQKAIGGTVTSVNGYTIHTFTDVGSTTFTPLAATNNSAILGLSDLSGRNNFATSANGPTYSSSNRGSIVFDGVDDYVGWNTLDAIKWQNWSSITVETVFTLVSYSGSTAGRQYLFDYRDSGGTNGAFGCFYDNNNSPNGFKLFYNTTGTSYEEPLITTFSLGTLIYHQVTFDKTTSTNNIRHYINGNNVFTRSVTVNSTTTNSGRIWLGRFSGGGYHWNGNIFLHRVYNRALTATEIQKNFNAQRGRFGI